MLIPSIDLLGGQIVQLVQGEKLRLAFDDFEFWIEKFSKYPLVQLIDLDAAKRQGNNEALVEQMAKRLRWCRWNAAALAYAELSCAASAGGWGKEGYYRVGAVYGRG